jgi:branched-chain amino acid transport system permease protein
LPGVAVVAGVAVLALAAPLLIDSFWLQQGLFAMAAAVAALGLTLLLGQAGQLSLGHSFFLAVGAYGYTFLAAAGDSRAGGLRLAPPLAAIAAVLLAGLAGLVFSPIAARLRGIYLGIATLGLVFLGQHVLSNAPRLTGGDNGRSVPVFSIAGLSFGTEPGSPSYVLNVLWGREQKLWYLFLAVTALGYLYFRGVARSRIGRALRAVRDRELMAGIVGVPVTRYKAYAFLISAMYAGLGGVLLALAFRRIVPETFGIALSIEYLAMVVIGGLGVAGGAIAGAAFVACLPSVLERYAGLLPGLATGPGEPGISPAIAGKFIYGAAVIAVLLLEPSGLAGLARRLRRRSPVETPAAPLPTPDPPTPDPPAQAVAADVSATTTDEGTPSAPRK